MKLTPSNAVISTSIKWRQRSSHPPATRLGQNSARDTPSRRPRTFQKAACSTCLWASQRAPGAPWATRTSSRSSWRRSLNISRRTSANEDWTPASRWTECPGTRRTSATAILMSKMAHPSSSTSRSLGGRRKFAVLFVFACEACVNVNVLRLMHNSCCVA